MSEKRVYTPDIAKKMGDDFGLSWKQFDAIQLADGMNVELEHGLVDESTNVSNDDPVITMKIALAHLNEFPDYYIRLEKMEEEAEAYWENR
ncbi:MAG: hypothetical protein KAQ68_06805 [Clostridiales bacterium]|nr:hypothetical protein [Clostridiales bacterium]